MATIPFPRIGGVDNLTWRRCFTLDRKGIKEEFIRTLVQNATDSGDNSTRKLAVLLLDMTSANDPKRDNHNNLVTL
jgi:hypothetical protein